MLSLNEVMNIASRDIRSDEFIRPPSTKASTVPLTNFSLGPLSSSVGVALYSNTEEACVEENRPSSAAARYALRSSGVVSLAFSIDGATQDLDPSALVLYTPNCDHTLSIRDISRPALKTP